jgi:hypothetical protein
MMVNALCCFQLRIQRSFLRALGFQIEGKGGRLVDALVRYVCLVFAPCLVSFFRALLVLMLIREVVLVLR